MHMISYRTKRLRGRSRINRIFKGGVFGRGTWVFRSFSLCFCGAGHCPSGVTLNGNPKGRTTSKWVFPLPAVIYLAKNLSGPKIFCSLSWFPLLIGNYFVFLRSFPFYFLPIFDQESFFSFSFLSFHSFLFISFSPFFSIFDWEFGF